MDKKYAPPEWAFEFHGHYCPFMPLGYRMGILALEKLGVEREKDHGLHVFSDLGVGHPQGCLLDGIMAATGATIGKGLVQKDFKGKLAHTFWYPGKTPIRYVLKPSFLDGLGRFEFFARRKAGTPPSKVPRELCDEVRDWIDSLPDDEVYIFSERPDFEYAPPKASFNKHLCAGCGEYVFERYTRMKDGKTYCMDCSGY